MRRPSLVLILAALGSSGCAASIDRTPRLDLTELASPAAPTDASGGPAWSDWDPSAATTPVTAASPAPLKVGGPWISHITLLGGGRWLDKDDWEPLEKQLTAGLEVDESADDGGNGYEAGVLYAKDEDNLESTTYEAYAGYRLTFRESTEAWHPFVSVGLSALYGELELHSQGTNPSDDDTIFGAYARAGLLWDLSERLRLGLDYRHLFAQDYAFEVAGQDLDKSGDYDQVMLSVGFEF